GESFRITCLDRILQFATKRHFLLNTFKYENVRIDRHTHRKHDTCNTGQRQCGREGRLRQHSKYEEDVEHKHDVCNKAALAVIHYHEDYHEYQTTNNGDETLIKCLLSKRGTYNAFFNNGQRCRERTCAKHVGQVFCFFNREVPCDLRIAIRNLSLHIGRRVHQVIEDNGNASLWLFRGRIGSHLCPHLCAGGIHRHAYSIPALLINFMARIRDRLTGQFRFAGTTDIEKIQLQSGLFRKAVPVNLLRLVSPVNANVSRQEAPYIRSA